MPVTYTDNFNLPMGADTTNNWGAIWNGIAVKIDREIKAAQSIITNRSGNVMVSYQSGEVILRHYQV